ncbi:MAG: hypothetical protein Q8Q15_04100, partial [bacterium]|nr:hypothetical protein [bacterium]
MKRLSFLLIAGGFAILLFTFSPIVREELQYRFDRWGGFKYSLDEIKGYPRTQIRLIEPKDTGFGIVVPKININASVYPQVDPTKPSEYLP